MNWRILVGLVFLLIGFRELYTIVAHPETIKLSVAPVYAELGCIIWMGVGVLLIVRGARMRGN